MQPPETLYSVKLTSEDWSFLVRALNKLSKYSHSDIESKHADTLAETLVNAVLEEYALNKHLNKVLNTMA